MVDNYVGNDSNITIIWQIKKKKQSYQIVYFKLAKSITCGKVGMVDWIGLSFTKQSFENISIFKKLILWVPHYFLFLFIHIYKKRCTYFSLLKEIIFLPFKNNTTYPNLCVSNKIVLFCVVLKDPFLNWINWQIVKIICFHVPIKTPHYIRISLIIKTAAKEKW